MLKIIKITKIEDAKPSKGVWYDYFDDVFISVIPFKRRAHIRRKAVLSTDKRDNGTSVWHLKWQYEVIEKNYGMNHSGKKTYEVLITVDDDRHIIDSLVNEKIAIEFQHTLSVDLEEMNKRSEGHSKAGFVAYLVLDLTDFTYQDYLLQDKKLGAKLEKWTRSIYHKNDKIFIDLEDKILRLSDNIAKQHIAYSQEEFVRKLLNLEDEINVLKSEWKKVLSKREEERRIADKRARANAEEKAYYRLQLAKEENREEKFKSPDYRYFRDCYQNKVIRPYVLKYAKDLFKYENYGDKEDENTYEKIHSFFSQERDFSIHYITVSMIEDITIQTYRGNRTKRKFTYLYAYVDVYLNAESNLETHRFEITNGQTVKLSS